MGASQLQTGADGDHEASLDTECRSVFTRQSVLVGPRRLLAHTDHSSGC
jgi:hypothetical protein